MVDKAWHVGCVACSDCGAPLTDRCFERAGRLCPAGGWTLVKVAKPKQDMRFDVPGVGPSTIESMIAAHAKVLAVEAGKTMIADREETLRKAEKARISVVGIPADGPVRDGEQ